MLAPVAVKVTELFKQIILLFPPIGFVTAIVGVGLIITAVVAVVEEQPVTVLVAVTE